MGFYGNVIFPRVLDYVMSTGQMKKTRAALLTEVSGDVFEVGFGTGLNLPFYPEQVKRLVTVDPNPGCNKRARKRIAASSIDVETHELGGESLPFDDACFDSIVCTWTLCSIAEVDKALAEMHRVLRPKGRLFFVEHGLADEDRTRGIQHRLNPLWKIIGDGCHLNRNMKDLIQDAHFQFASLENFYMPKSPKWASYMYKGIAVKG
ncbi:MAG: class I SAM-dependent methyltransferase [Candidatus Hydrogenedentes bacterium]|nr:class I SAM-dependent methyltransferase [Candidatus Hydrogenedentota bacterium]